MEKHLSNRQFLIESENRAGLIPVDLDTRRRRIKWMDLENYHFYEGFFHKSLKMFAALKGESPITEFTTDFDVLWDEKIFNGNISPTGFIFHAGRSGSTLLAKALARSRKNLVLSELSAHNKFWLAVTDEGAKNIDFSEQNAVFYKNLLLAAARRRLASHENCFIKFTSYNIFFYDFIRRAFPEVPAIFLYREPSAVLSSISRKPLDWTQIKDTPVRELLTKVSETEFLSLNAENYLIKVLGNLFSAGEKASGNLLKPFNYKDLKPENFASIQKIFNVRFPAREIGLMKSQFGYDSKTENKRVGFSSDNLEKTPQTADLKQTGISRALRKSYDELEEKRNI